jgi:hypothetical protein
MQCPKHKKNMNRAQKRWCCSKRDCNKEFLLLHQSIFANSKIDPNQILQIFYLRLANVPSTSIQLITGHSSATIAQYLSDFRGLLAGSIYNNLQMIGGKGIVVEIDETLISRRKNPWTSKDGVWVFGGVERTGEKRMFSEMVPDRTSKTLLESIKRNIHPDSTIISDCWTAYKSIGKKLKMDHMTVDHSKNFKDPITGAHTNHAEAMWYALKRKIPNSERIPEKIDNYIFEFMWRHQNENRIWEAFLECLAEVSYI